MISYPMSFSANVSSNAATSDHWAVRASDLSSSCAIPNEFGGPGGAFSPEDFFVLALSNCFVATFKVYAQASKFSFDEIHVQGNLVLDKVEGNQPMAKSCEIYVSLDGVTDLSRAVMILKKVARSGILLNSVKTELHFDFTVNGEKVA